jgi:hypothetical protein
MIRIPLVVPEPDFSGVQLKDIEFRPDLALYADVNSGFGALERAH